MVTVLAIFALGIWLSMAVGQLVLVIYARRKSSREQQGPATQPPLSLLKPLKGAPPDLRENLESFFRLDYPQYELLFSVSDENDPALEIVRELQAKYPDRDARWVCSPKIASVINPKIGTLMAPYAAAKYDWLLLTDSNVHLPTDYLRNLSRYLTPATGLVTAVPMAFRASGIGGRLDASMLNTFYAKGMWLGALLGRPIAAAKSQCFRRSEAERFGGLAVLGDYLADDVRLGKLFEKQGLGVCLMAEPVPQSCVGLSVRAFWLRHLRWFRNRRSLLPKLYWMEPFLSTLGAGLAGAFAARFLFGWQVGFFLAAHFLFFWLTDSFFSHGYNPVFWVLSLLARHLLWVQGLLGREVEWGGKYWRLHPGGRIEPL